MLCYFIKFQIVCPEKNGRNGGFCKKNFPFLRIWSFYSYITFYHRDNRENYRILVEETKQVVLQRNFMSSIAYKVVLYKYLCQSR